MGEVYRAVDTRHRRKVALKVLRTDDSENADGVARLFREARAAAALTHPNTVAIHDLGESEDLFYIVMELVSGQPLLAYVGDDRVSLARRLKWLTEIARALATAHKAGVIHRDVKPSNVMVSEEDVAKVLDFGLAKPLPKAGEPESFGFKTQAGRVLGTIRYMAPEQMIGSEADGRSDQYSLGMTAFELIAGKYPPGKAFEIPPLLNTLVKDFPADGALAIARMLKRIPEDRFGSMEDVVGAFEDMAANRPVRAVEGAKPSPKAVVIDDKTVLDPPNKHSPDTLPETSDEPSADTVLATDGALALARTVMPDDPIRPKQPSFPETEPAPEVATPSQAPSSNPAASTTLQSADAGDRVRAVREATAKAMASEMNQVAATLASSKSNEPENLPRVAPAKKVEIIEDEARDSKSKASSVGSTLASKGASDAVMAVRAATAKTPARVESVPPPKPKSSKKDAESERPAKKSNLLWILLTIAFLALAAFAGNYFGARSRAKD
jgi:serine/threonine-protein kinase